jgi:hypothetical protein
LPYIISFDEDAGSYAARSTLDPVIRGSGRSLFAAIDDLEAKLEKGEEKHPGALTIDVAFQEKPIDKVEINARILISV